ncbi:restriction endonuclease subunit S [Methylocaldum gracile]|jgi:type I restriction enzyme S subunit
MSRINDLLARLCPEGVEFKAIGDFGDLVRGNGMPKSDFVESGVGCIHYGQIYTDYGIWTTETKSFISVEKAKKLAKVDPGDLVITNTSENIEDVCKAVAWLGDAQIVTGGHATVLKHSQDAKYLSYYLQTPRFFAEKKKHATGTKVIDVSAKSLAKIRIPIPPLEVQREIVKVLDTFTMLEAELEAELEARRRQYQYYRDALLSFDERMSGASKQARVRWATLGEICKSVSSGGTPLSTRPDYYGGDIPWLRTQEVRYTDIHDTEIKITEKGLKESAAKWIPANCVIVAISGATAARSAINKIPLTTNQHCCNLEIDPAQANYRYVFHWVSNEYERLKAYGQGARADLNSGLIKSYPIPIPPLEEQARIVAILDKFDALVNDLSSGLPAEIKARRQQYEHYRDRLLSFREAA